MPWNDPKIFQLLSLFLLGCGLMGLISRRTFLGMLISFELILNGAGLNLMTVDRFFYQDLPRGEVFTLFIMGVAASETAVVLAIMILLFRKYKTIEEEKLKGLKG